ncbi:MAG: hypothetical protein U0470_00110 [Anaerolineae bacterium]
MSRTVMCGQSAGNWNAIATPRACGFGVIAAGVAVAVPAALDTAALTTAPPIAIAPASGRSSPRSAAAA